MVGQHGQEYTAVSNFTVANLKAYQNVQNNMSVRSRIVAVQNQFDILSGESGSHEGVLEFASHLGISFITWSPLAKGFLTEKYLDLNSVGRPGDRLFDEGMINGNMELFKMEKIKKIA